MALYENGGVTSTAQNNATNAQKAAKFDELMAAKRDQDSADAGFAQGREQGAAEVVEQLLKQREQTPRHGLASMYPSDESLDRLIEFGHKAREFLGLPSQRPVPPPNEPRFKVEDAEALEQFIKQSQGE